MTNENGQWADLLSSVFCRKTTPAETAPNTGWIPSFWHNGNEYSKEGTGICPDCVAAHLKFNEEFGDYELLPDHPLPNE